MQKGYCFQLVGSSGLDQPSAYDMSRYKVIIKTLVTITVIVLLTRLLSVAPYLKSSLNFGNAKERYSQRPLVCNAAAANRTREDQENILAIFTGRWKFLRIYLPYVYRELRVNGGVLDKVVFMMVDYDNLTYNHLLNFTKIANGHLNRKVFEFNFLGHSFYSTPPGKAGFREAYYDMFNDLMRGPYNRYFKSDDDIVYVHPGTFRKMIEGKNSCECFMHFANTVTNWRCNVKHQQMGLFDSEEVNPRRLRFEFNPLANCGWWSSECAELTLRAFLHYYSKKQLDRYTFAGHEMLFDRRRFTINLHLLDLDLVNVQALQEVGPIGIDDELWWTEVYAPVFTQPNCIVGESLIVHFSYSLTCGTMIELGLLNEFESIVRKEIGQLMHKKLWDALEFGDRL